MPQLSRYLLISPVKDEEAYVEQTLASIAGQTVPPACWILVDDGSRDRTPLLLERFAEAHSWAAVLRLERQQKRQPGGAVIEAFQAGLRSVNLNDFDFVVKLDCDLHFPPDYFERLLCQFQKDGKLGIASGVYFEKEGKGWREIRMPEYHAAGACKVLRTECFQQIGGFIAARGWDTIDEVKAQMSGWKTKHFRDLHFRHLKREGGGLGPTRWNVVLGEIYYLTGGGLLFFALKTFYRAFSARPILLASLLSVFGYVRAWMRNAPRVVSESERRFYRNLLNLRVRQRLSILLGLFKTPLA